MKLKLAAFLLLAGLLSVTAVVRAQDTNKIPPEILRLVNNLKYRQGTIDLKGGTIC
jgi:hypothetical protein